jgi:hypothetical protein
MLETIAVILTVLWLLGLVSSYTMGDSFTSSGGNGALTINRSLLNVVLHD